MSFQQFVETYIRTCAPREVNFGSELKKKFHPQLTEFNDQLLIEMKDELVGLMQKDTFRRFLIEIQKKSYTSGIKY